MHSKAMAVAAMALLTMTPLALCSCGNHQQQETTADSAGTPAGWTGHKIKLNDPKNGQKPGPGQPADQTATANK